MGTEKSVYHQTGRMPRLKGSDKSSLDNFCWLCQQKLRSLIYQTQSNFMGTAKTLLSDRDDAKADCSDDLI